MKSLSDLSAEIPCSLREGIRLREFTTLKTGGPARYLLEPRNLTQAVVAYQVLSREKIPVRFLGGGSNVLIPDEGFDGAVILTNALKGFQRNSNSWNVEAGVSLPGLVHDASDAGLAGLEGFVGIPGSIGGAVSMNSGGRHGEIWDRIEEIEVGYPDGSRKVLKREQVRPQYRHGNLGEAFCLRVVLKLEKSDPRSVREKTASVLADKAAAQPLQERSAGCIFKNPTGHSAGKSIDVSGCKGWSEGSATVSEKHGNFIVNRGGATAQDVKQLIRRVQAGVKEKLGLDLETEIVIW